MRRTMVMVRRLALLAFATSGLLVVATEPAHAVCDGKGCCPWGAVQSVAPATVQSVAPATGEPDPQYCQPQHCEPVLRH